MNWYQIAEVFFLAGIFSGLLLIRTKNLGKLVTGLFASVGSGCSLYYGLTILLNKADSSLSMDALSAFFVVLISFLSLIASIYAFGYLEEYRGKKNLNILGALFNVFVLAMLSVVSSRNAYSFLMAWETMSIASFFLVLTDYEKESVRKAGFIYVVMTHIGTAFIILAFLLLAKWTGGMDFSNFSHASNVIPQGIRTLIFLAFFIGFGTKAGIIPLHIWLPRAHPVAPSHVSALMSGVMVKTAIYGLIRVVFSFLGADTALWGEIILVFGALSALLGVMYALMQNDIKRLLAYSTVENVGIILIAVGLAAIFSAYGQHTLAGWALVAALFHSLNHAVFKGLLFMGAGTIHKNVHTKNMELLGGLLKVMPWTGVFFLIGSMAISALPPLNGFASEWLVYQSLLTAGIILPVVWQKMLVIFAAAALALTGALAAYCFVKAFGISFLALPRSEEAGKAHEAEPAMLLAMAVLAFACVGLGVFAPWVVRYYAIAVEQVLHIQLHVSGAALPGTYSKQGFTQFNPLLLLLLLFVVALVLYLVTKFTTKYKKVRLTETWTCGIIPTARMEYSAASFTQPLRIVFSSILCPQRELTKEGETEYFLEKMHYHTSVKPIYEDYLYKPLHGLILYFANKLRAIQSGQIQLYIVYIFAALVFLLIWAL